MTPLTKLSGSAHVSYSILTSRRDASCKGEISISILRLNHQYHYRLSYIFIPFIYGIIIQFQTDGNRVWTWKPLEFGFNDSFHERVQTFRDLDGSVTGTPNSTIIKPYEFYVTEYCVYQPYWRMAVCPFLYARVNV